MKKITLVILLITSTFSYSQERCATEIYSDLLEEKYPEYAVQRQKVNSQTQKWIKNNPIISNKTIITIPVVIHVVWNTNAENISDAQIYSQMDVLNADFRRTNADASSTPSIWQSIAADSEIEFCLATIDPNGSATTGITRTQSSQTSFSINDSYMKSTSNGGIDPWPKDDYLNIWVCDLTGGILGYATPPSNFNNPEDGVVVCYKYFGTIGSVQSPYNQGRTSTHEVGHWLNLNHIWGNGNGCGNDNVSDTPIQDQNYSCPGFPHDVNGCGINSNGDMFMNYMDYTDDACMNLFTNGQKTRMISAINQYRSNLLSHNICSGVDNCIAESIPISEDFQNNNLSSNWNLINNDNEKTWEVTSLAGFNSNSSIYINNEDYAANGEIDDLVLPVLNLTSSSPVELLFDYSYSLWTDPSSNPNYSDTLQVWASGDCGITWQKLWEKSGVDLVTSSSIFTESAWIPESNIDWKSESIDLNSYINQDDFVLKFRNINDYENNIFLDNINITGNTILQSWDCDVEGNCNSLNSGNGQYSTFIACKNECISSSVEDIDDYIAIYPNPTNMNIIIDFESSSTKIIIEVYSILGENIYSKEMSGFSGQFRVKINLEDYSQGVYIVNVISNSGQLYTKRISYIK